MKKWWIGGRNYTWVTDGLRWYRYGVRYRDVRWSEKELEETYYKQIPALRALLLTGDT